MHMDTRTCSPTCTHAHLHIHALSHIDKDTKSMHIYTCAHTHAHKCAGMYPQAHTQIQVSKHTPAIPAFDHRGRRAEMLTEARVRGLVITIFTPSSPNRTASLRQHRSLEAHLSHPCLVLWLPQAALLLPTRPDFSARSHHGLNVLPVLPTSGLLFTSAATPWRPQDLGIRQQAGTPPNDIVLPSTSEKHH